MTKGLAFIKGFGYMFVENDYEMVLRCVVGGKMSWLITVFKEVRTGISDLCVGVKMYAWFK